MNTIQTSIEAVDAAIAGRRSIRAYLSTPVSYAQILDLIQISQRAPSGTNTQPWHVYALTGASKQAVCAEVTAAFLDPVQSAQHKEEYAYYPTQWKSPFVDRRRKVGFDLYGLLGLGKEHKSGMQAQHAKNYDFFGAPVGLFFTIDRMMGQGSWLDYGMFLQNVMVAARARGLDTCAQAAWTQYHKIIAKHLQLPDDQMLVCGMALGYADLSKIENTLITEREPVVKTVTFLE
jgi:nitroreductase